MSKANVKNKYERTQKEKNIHIKRCQVLGLEPIKHYEYKAQAKPCSCMTCKPEKYKREKWHEKD